VATSWICRLHNLVLHIDLSGLAVVSWSRGVIYISMTQGPQAQQMSIRRDLPESKSHRSLFILEGKRFELRFGAQNPFPQRCDNKLNASGFVAPWFTGENDGLVLSNLQQVASHTSLNWTRSRTSTPPVTTSHAHSWRWPVHARRPCASSARPPSRNLQTRPCTNTPQNNVQPMCDSILLQNRLVLNQFLITSNPQIQCLAGFGNPQPKSK